MKDKSPIIITGIVLIIMVMILTINTHIFLTSTGISIAILVLYCFNVTKRLATYLALIFSVLIVWSVTSLNLLLILVSVLLIVSINFFVSNELRKQKDLRFKQEKLLVAKSNIVDDTSFCIFIFKDNKLLWANDKTYDEFPELLKDRSIKDFSKLENGVDFEKNNKIYSVRIEEEIYYLKNVTHERREFNVMKDRQVVIGLLQIDNYFYFEQQLKTDEFLEMERSVKKHITNLFSEHNIFYNELNDDRYQMILPLSFIESEQEERFPSIQSVVDSIRDEEFEVTLSCGIALGYDSAHKTGEMAREALDLAISRGGAQTIVLNNDRRNYYGGKVNALKNSSKIRARFVYNTIQNNLEESEQVYIMTHRDPDFDACGSALLLKNLIERQNTNLDISVKVVLDSKMDKEILEKCKEIAGDDIVFDAVVDQTKKNLLIIVDTQSTDLISHPHLYESINDCVVLDHHQTPEKYIGVTLFSWIEPNASSTTELICEMYNSLNLGVNNKQLAKLGLLGILTDTNYFKYRTDKYAISAVSFLVSSDISIYDAMEELQIDKDSYEQKLQLLQEAEFKNGFAIVNTNQKLDPIIQAITADDLVDIKGIDCSVVICKQDEDGLFRVKIRSSNKINSKTLIEEFGGGGHARQAAAVLPQSKVKELIKKIETMETEWK